MREIYSLRFRLLVTVGAVAALGFIICVTLVSMQGKKAVESLAYEQLDATAQRYAAVFSGRLASGVGATRDMVLTLESAMKNATSDTRKVTDEYLKQSLVSDPMFYGTWTMVEEDKFDGHNADYKGVKIYGLNGEYEPYFTMEEGILTGVEVESTYEEDASNDYYKIPYAAGKMCLIAPYLDDQVNKLMTSIAAPVHRDGVIVGVAGVDLLLTMFNDMVKEIHPFETGSAFLVANDGMYVGHPDGARAGKNIAEYGASEALLTAIKEGKPFEEYRDDEKSGETLYIKYVPVKIGETDTPWSFAVSVPLSTVLADARKLTLLSAVIGVISVVALLGVLFLIANAITKPLKQAVAAFENIAQGDGDLTVRLPEGRRDETGQMAQWANVFIAKIHDIVRQISKEAVLLDGQVGTMSKTSELLLKSSKTTQEDCSNAGAAIRNASSEVSDIAQNAQNSKNTTQSVAAATEEVSASLKAVANAVRATSERMESVREATDELQHNVSIEAAAIEELSASLREVSRYTGDAARMAQDTATKAGNASEKIDQLGKAAGEINEVVEIISGIASKINLLALNATIEAASAGDAGKGFAVVASEVKTLARQTAGATETIRAKIEAIQSSTLHATEAVGGITGAIAEVNAIAGTIAHAVEQQNEATREISGSVQTTARRADEIAGHVRDAAQDARIVYENVEEAAKGANTIAEEIVFAAASSAEIAEKTSLVSNSMEVTANIMGDVNQEAGATAKAASMTSDSATAVAGIAAHLNELVQRFTL